MAFRLYSDSIRWLLRSVEAERRLAQLDLRRHLAIGERERHRRLLDLGFELNEHLTGRDHLVSVDVQSLDHALGRTRHVGYLVRLDHAVELRQVASLHRCARQPQSRGAGHGEQCPSHAEPVSTSMWQLPFSTCYICPQRFHRPHYSKRPANARTSARCRSSFRS